MDQFGVYENEQPCKHPHSGQNRLAKIKGHSLVVDTTGAAPSAAENGENKHLWKAVAASLGLLCLLLLIGLIVLAFLFARNNSEWEAQMALLHARFNNLTQDNHQLQTSHNKVSEERDQLQTNCTLLTSMKHQLQERLESLLKERAKLEAKLGAREGWKYFRGGFYLVSSGMKTWQQSRDDCRQRGADLLIINSEEEQNFTNQFKKSMWIGLTDSEQEGTWKWVDGTPVKNSFWRYKEPNGERREHCGSVEYFNYENSWNDKMCSTELSWICEK